MSILCRFGGNEKMRVEFFYGYSSPWNDAELCTLGLWTLREKGSWFQVGLGFLFFTVGLHFGKPIFTSKEFQQ